MPWHRQGEGEEMSNLTDYIDDLENRYKIIESKLKIAVEGLEMLVNKCYCQDEMEFFAKETLKKIRGDSI